jgi:hypothetical protein
VPPSFPKSPANSIVSSLTPVCVVHEREKMSDRLLQPRQDVGYGRYRFCREKAVHFIAQP